MENYARRIRSLVQWGVSNIAPLAYLGSGKCQLLCATSKVIAVFIEGIEKIFFIPTKRTSLPGGLAGVHVPGLMESYKDYYRKVPFPCSFSPDGCLFVIRFPRPKGFNDPYPLAATVIHSDDGYFMADAVRVLSYSPDETRRIEPYWQLLFGSDGELHEQCGDNIIRRLNFDGSEGILRIGPHEILIHGLKDYLDECIHYTQGRRVAVAIEPHSNGDIFGGFGFLKAAPGRENFIRCMAVNCSSGLIWDDICDESFKEYRLRLPCGQKRIVVEQELSDKGYFINKGKLFGGTIQPDFHSLAALCRARCLSLATYMLKQAHPDLELYSNDNFIKAFLGHPLEEEDPILTLRRD